MALKYLAHKPPAPLPAAPAWGIISDDGEPPGVLRLEWQDRSESIPYHTLTRWSLESGDSDTLVIIAGGVTVTVRGRELVAVRDALDTGRLACLRAVGARYALARTGTVITEITVK
jgi:hypothetical protein